jgi:hypothetical protein
MISRVTFIPDENSIKDKALVGDFIDRIDVCLDKLGSDEFLRGLRDSVKKSGSYTPAQYWRLQQVEENLLNSENDFFAQD